MKVKYEPFPIKRALKKARSDTLYQCSHFISPYVGCEFGCVYCDRATIRKKFRGRKEDLSILIQVKENIPSILKKELKTAKKGVVCLAGYQPAEEEFRLVRRILELLRTRKFPVHVVTKSDMVLDDLELISKISENVWCTVSFNINTLDEKIAEIFEPDAPSPIDRMKALGKFAEKGVSTGVILAPILPYIMDMDEQLEEIIKKASGAKADYVLSEPLRLEDDCRARIIEAIKRNFPEMLLKYRKLYEFGPAPDVIYSTKLKNRINSLLKKYRIANSMPPFSENHREKQASIQDFLGK